MARYVINGGVSLNGEVTVSGAKNAAVAILPAALLVNGKCRIENVPDISDVRILLTSLKVWAQKSVDWAAAWWKSTVPILLTVSQIRIWFARCVPVIT